MHRQFALLCISGVAALTGCSGTGSSRSPRGLAPPAMIGAEEGGRVARVMPIMAAEPEVEIQRPEWSDPYSRTNPGNHRTVVASFQSRVATQTRQAPIVTVTGQKLESALVESLNTVTTQPEAESELDASVTPLPIRDMPIRDMPIRDTSVASVNLPTALAMVGPQHPAVGFARWRVQQAYAQLDQARVLWLPSLRGGFGFHRHDGNYQASNGEIVDVNRNSFQYGLGLGATGAGTTTIPGIVAEFHLADAIFQPKIAGRTAAARSFESQAVLNQQLLTAAVAYLELLGSHQDVRVLEEIRERAADLSKLTSDFAATGAGLQADADRMETELALADNRLLAARERAEVAGARLAEAVSAESQVQWMPTDLTVLPLDVVSLQVDRASMIQTGLASRPELREAQSLVAAACERYRREKFSPFVPSVLLGFSSTGFGGGLGNTLNNVDERYDFDALVGWEIRNLGFGEHAARRDTSAQIQQAKFEKIRTMDQVAREVSEAYSRVRFRSQQVTVAQQAIQQAMDSYDRNVSRIRDGQGLPLESLQSLRALEEAQRAYVSAVVGYNQAQFELQWALGWPVTAPSQIPEAITDDTI